MRAFIRSRVTKNEFERQFLTHFEQMYEIAQKVTERMEHSGYPELYQDNIEAENSSMEIIIITISGLVPEELLLQILNISEWMYRYRIYTIFCAKSWKNISGKKAWAEGFWEMYESARPLEDREKELAWTLSFLSGKVLENGELSIQIPIRHGFRKKVWKNCRLQLANRQKKSDF